MNELNIWNTNKFLPNRFKTIAPNTGNSGVITILKSLYGIKPVAIL